MKALQKTAISAAAVALLTGLTSVAAFAEEAAAPEEMGNFNFEANFRQKRQRERIGIKKL